MDLNKVTVDGSGTISIEGKSHMLFLFPKGSKKEGFTILFEEGRTSVNIELSLEEANEIREFLNRYL